MLSRTQESMGMYRETYRETKSPIIKAIIARIYVSLVISFFFQFRIAPQKDTQLCNDKEVYCSVFTITHEAFKKKLCIIFHIDSRAFLGLAETSAFIFPQSASLRCGVRRKIQSEKIAEDGSSLSKKRERDRESYDGIGGVLTKSGMYQRELARLWIFH